MVLPRATLLIGVLLGTSPAGAQELRQEMIGLLRSTDCALSLEKIEDVFTVMKHGPDEVTSVTDELIASGEADLSPDRRTLVLAPEVCRAPVTAPRRVAAVPWIEDRLAAVPECRMPLAELAGEAEASGVTAEDFGRAVQDLSALGRYVPEGEELGLRADLCAPGREVDRSLARIEALGQDALRATLGLLAMEQGCRLSLVDRPGLLQDLGEMAIKHLYIGRDLSADAKAALEHRLAEALENPGPVYRVDQGTDELVALHCQP